MRATGWVFGLGFLLAGSGAVASEPATAAITFAQKAFKVAQSPLLRWGAKGEMERKGALRKWSASTCPMPNDAPRFEAIPEALAQYCDENGGRMQDARCWKPVAGGEATWFAYAFERQGPCGGNVSMTGGPKPPRYVLEVYELEPDAIGEPAMGLEWAKFGLPIDQKVQTMARMHAKARADVAAFDQQMEDERVAREARQIKTKGTQVCMVQDGGTLLGFVEDVSGDRIKVLVSARYWGDIKFNRRDTSFQQQYTWSEIRAWRLC